MKILIIIAIVILTFISSVAISRKVMRSESEVLKIEVTKTTQIAAHMVESQRIVSESYIYGIGGGSLGLILGLVGVFVFDKKKS